MKIIIKKTSFPILFYVTALILMVFVTSCEKDTIQSNDHFEPFGIQIIDLNSSKQDVLIKVFKADFDKNYPQSLSFKKGIQTTYKVEFLDENGGILNYPDSEDLSLGINFSDTTLVNNVSANPLNKWELIILATRNGTTEAEVVLKHNGHIDFRTPMFKVFVTE